MTRRAMNERRVAQARHRRYLSPPIGPYWRGPADSIRAMHDGSAGGRLADRVRGAGAIAPTPSGAPQVWAWRGQTLQRAGTWIHFSDVSMPLETVSDDNSKIRDPMDFHRPERDQSTRFRFGCATGDRRHGVERITAGNRRLPLQGPTAEQEPPFAACSSGFVPIDGGSRNQSRLSERRVRAKHEENPQLGADG